MKTIPLYGKHGIGKEVVVDDDDFEWASSYRWNLWQANRRFPGHAPRFYPRTHIDGNYPKMHREIAKRMGLIDDGEDSKGVWIDHKNNNTLDNQRHNLRIATVRENARNSNSRFGSSSQYKGVSFYKPHGRWVARIKKARGNNLHLGYFLDEELAAKNYDYHCISMYGEFSRLNFPDFDYSDFIPHRPRIEPE